MKAVAGQTCPRRLHEWGPWPKEQGLDGWAPGHGLIGQPRGCTFCGSMHPDDFMDAVRAGLEIEPTDKNYVRPFFIAVVDAASDAAP